MALILPYRVAFLDDNEDWGPFDIAEMVFNGVFFMDIILNFFTAYYDPNENLVLDKKVINLIFIIFGVLIRNLQKIAKNYLFSWFLIDVVSTLPLQNIIMSTTNYNQMMRISKVPKIFRFIKMSKYLKFLSKILNFIKD